MNCGRLTSIPMLISNRQRQSATRPGYFWRKTTPPNSFRDLERASRTDGSLMNAADRQKNFGFSSSHIMNGAANFANEKERFSNVTSKMSRTRHFTRSEQTAVSRLKNEWDW